VPLTFHPNPGTVLLCNYDTGFVPPEMVKRRPVVVISPRLRNRDGLCTVVPLSSTAPNQPMDYHCQVRIVPALPAPWTAPSYWVKADMLATVGFNRLELIREKRQSFQARKNVIPVLGPDELLTIRNCVLHALGLGALTNGG
jgi:mRNA interferase MazF